MIFAQPSPVPSRQEAANFAPQPGHGVRLTNYEGLGYVLGAPGGGGGRYGHPWRPFLGAGGVKLSKGLVEGIEPRIGSEAMSETVLPLEASVANDAGESWLVLEVEPNKEGRLLAAARIEVVHSRETVSFDPELGRMALTMILWKGGRPAQALPIAMFNLRYLRYQPAPGGGPVRHLFL
jgi:hypothetical protein